MDTTIKEIKALDLVAYLLMVGIKYIDPPRLAKDGTVWFAYQSTPEFLDAFANFYLQKASVNPNAFNSHLREVHRTVKAMQKGGEF